MNVQDSPALETPASEGQLRLWDSISIIVGIVIGASIFQVPNLIFSSTPGPWMSLAVWAVGGLLALVGALCYAELATTYPRSGGDYNYLTRAFGPWMGFLFGWAQLTVVLTASIGAMAHVFATYATGLYDLTKVVDVGLSSEFLYAALAVLLLSAMNIVGVAAGRRTQNLLTIAKVIGLGGILVAGFAWSTSSPTEWEPISKEKLGWGALAMILVLYAYGGWNDAAFVAAEVRDPARNIPRALIFGVGAITVIYLLVNTAYLIGLGFETASHQPRLPVLLLEKPLGEWGATAISILVMISALGAVNGLTFTGARVYATLGNDYPLFGWLGHWKAGQRPPTLALIAQALITLAIISALTTETGHHWINQALRTDAAWQPGRGFQTLVDHTAPVFWLFFLLTGLSLFQLRDKNPHLRRPFSVPWYPVLPLIFCNTCLYMLYKSVDFVGWRSLFALGVVLIGLPLYWLARLVGYRGEQQ